MSKPAKIAIFEGKRIRRYWDDKQEKWYFSVVDVVAALTNQTDFTRARKYWNKLAERLRLEGSEVVTKCHQLKMQAADGKMRLTDVADTEVMLRIIQSVPSPRAEPLKLWLARVGYERVKEIEDPELGTKRTRMLYKLKGYPEDWIEKRMRGIVIREELTDEWQKRGAQVQRDYEILTAEISEATFGVTPSEYKKLKNLKRENLRDHMDDLELIFTMLGERATTEIHKTRDTQGMPELQKDAQDGGGIAGGARKKLEKQIGRPIVSGKNYLPKGRRSSGVK